MVLLEYTTAGDTEQKVSLLFSSKQHISTLFPWERLLLQEHVGLYQVCEGKKGKNGK